jgi:PhzF family phenazine biosynthesis protein
MKVTFVDVFTSERFRGNNAAVCFVDRMPDAAFMQALAAELAQPVTAFLDPKTLALRWFAPKAELPLCGHGTLAAAHALWETPKMPGQLTFGTAGGPIRARQAEGRIEIDLPATQPKAASLPDLGAMLGAKPVWIGEGAGKIVALLESEEAVRTLRPDLDAIARLPVSGVVVTARGEKQFDFISRFFCPAHGIGEDPVTGSAHAVLAPFWAERLGKRSFVAWQASARGGLVHARLESGAGVGERAIIGGAAVTLLRGELS